MKDALRRFEIQDVRGCEEFCDEGRVCWELLGSAGAESAAGGSVEATVVDSIVC